MTRTASGLRLKNRHASILPVPMREIEAADVVPASSSSE